MMPSTRVVLLLATTAILPSALGQQQSSLNAALAQLPPCAVSCMLTTFTHGICDLTNQTCACTDKQFEDDMTTCVMGNCTVVESLETKNITSTICGLPIRDQEAEFRVISYAMFALAAIAVLIRFGFKLWVGNMKPSMPDWLILATVICVIPSTVITEVGTLKNGLGKDVWTLTPKQISQFGLYFWIMCWLYFLEVTLTKLSMLFFYLQIFTRRGVKRLLWATIIFTCLYGFAYVVGTLACRPDVDNAQLEDVFLSKCVHVDVISWSHAAISIVLDLWMLAIPLWQIRHLQLGRKKKIGVALMFGVGTFVTVISIIRLRSLVLLSDSSNLTWGYYEVSVWSAIEVGVGVMCACMPAIRLFLVRMFPVLGSSTTAHPSSGQSRRYEKRVRSSSAKTPVTGTTGTTGTSEDHSYDLQPRPKTWSVVCNTSASTHGSVVEEEEEELEEMRILPAAYVRRTV